MLPTVADVLELDVVRRGLPKVLTAAERLDTAVRWVHVIELAEARHLLRGGELVLTTGIALPPDAPGLTKYVAGLAAAGVSAVAVELGSRYVRELPAALVAAAAVHRLPLIMLQRETEFIAVTEAVHAQILDARVAELRAAERLHQVFTDLAVAGAGADEVVAQASALAGVPVILADLAHRVLACSPAGQETEPLLAGFAGRSRTVSVPGRCDYDKAAGWLVAKVGQTASTRPGTVDWARLIFVFSAPPGPADFVLAERTATALTLARLVRAGQDAGGGHELLAAHKQLLADLAGPGFADPADLEARITALGIPLAGHNLQTLVIDAQTGASVRTVTDALAAACSTIEVPAIVGELAGHRVGGLLALPAEADADQVLRQIANSVRCVFDGWLVIGAGPVVPTIAEARAALYEADVAASALIALGDRADFGEARSASTGADRKAANTVRPFARLADLRLAGLIYQLRDHPALLAFAERELGPLLRHDEAAGTDLVQVLTCYLRSGGNKAEAAQLAGLARPTLYERLRKIEQVLDRKLDTPQSQLSLHVALLAHPACPGAVR
ncbi:MAG TPA: PucR family transcriptional regulator ligand-binding domain-containing protein [Streptosporangiaceae bacterium]|nr:PucR family transcriptional regulator ligand-binding domain-containing protein [Streptosporangiaceae bacterium]